MVAVGLGLVAGAFALMVGTVGFMSKLVADGVEEVPPGPREAVLSVGVTRGQETVTSVVGPGAGAASWPPPRPARGLAGDQGCPKVSWFLSPDYI